ncbi:ribosome-binding factor A [Desulfarculus baarsii DSM 2075]|uniref:Ribosome-binding factor A n=1 Tax=Desulfarculus baarsii (strain ATCC 33931 / DSM 2075 / LMG 7858 / VKM B-1802 / 2st14) TaxID=644282 RepID=E1QFC7_DESB2|nr:30S ribosome-binding factor RbfA [Desulfarculus baarsii]ADK84263.1 ribosome-binding factor A [Desulfarculus baarsii DSM 2075]
MGARRTRRVGNLILAELAELLLRRVKDPRLEGLTLTAVDVSPDLHQAKVFYSLLDPQRQPQVEAGFAAAAPFLRRELAARLRIKTLPRLEAVFDGSIVRGLAMDELIKKARQADGESAAGQDAAPADEPDDA